MSIFSSCRRFTAGILAGWIVLITGHAQGGDWPQILGPNRDGRAVGERLDSTWPGKGPRVLWKYQLGTGYAGPAVVGDRVVVFHRVGDVERVESLHANTGKSLWKADFSATYQPGINPDNGPRCVPLVARGNVYVFGAAGDLHSVTLGSGKKRWSRRTYLDYGGAESFFGAGSTPIWEDGKLLVNVGGRDGAGLVAFDAATGKTLWRATNERASYSSPTAATIGGQRHVIFVTRYNTVSVDPANGAVRFRFPFGKRGPTINAATPLVFDGHLFVSASYQVGAVLAKIDGQAAKQIWASDQALSSQYNTSVQDNGYLYGIHGREDLGIATLRCVEAKTGKIVWSEERFGVAHLILADGKLLIEKIDGQLMLAAASPQGFRKLAQSRVSSETTRALPALSQGKLYLRTSNPQGGSLVCLKLVDL